MRIIHDETRILTVCLPVSQKYLSLLDGTAKRHHLKFHHLPLCQCLQPHQQNVLYVNEIINLRKRNCALVTQITTKNSWRLNLRLSSLISKGIECLARFSTPKRSINLSIYRNRMTSKILIDKIDAWRT